MSEAFVWLHNHNAGSNLETLSGSGSRDSGRKPPLGRNVTGQGLRP